MLKYPVMLERDDNTVMVTSPDFPELSTFGMDREEAIARAADALEEAIATRIHDGLDIPLPSKGRDVAVLPTLTAVKVMLYRGMREQGVGKAELARRLGWHLPQVDRVLDVQHNSRMDQMDAAMGAIGRHLYVRDSVRCVSPGQSLRHDRDSDDGHMTMKETRFPAYLDPCEWVRSVHLWADRTGRLVEEVRLYTNKDKTRCSRYLAMCKESSDQFLETRNDNYYADVLEAMSLVDAILFKVSGGPLEDIRRV